MADESTPTPVQVHTLMPAGNGGKLRRGNPGNRSRPASIIRDDLKGDFDKRRKFLHNVIDGKHFVETRIPVDRIIHRFECTACGSKAIKATGKMEGDILVIRGKQSASVADRLKAVDILAKYGLDSRTAGIDINEVRDKVAASIDIIRRRCDAALAQLIVAEMRPVWK